MIMYGSHRITFQNMLCPWLSQTKRFPTPGLDHVMAHRNYSGNHFQQHEHLLPDGKRNWMQKGGPNKSPFSLEIYGLMQELAATRSTFQEQEINTFHGNEFGSILATRETNLSNKSDLIYTEQGRAPESEWNRNEDDFVVTFNSDYEDYGKSQNASCNGWNPKNKETDITQLHSSQTGNKSLRISPELDNEDKITDSTSSSSDAESDVSNPIESPCVNQIISNQFVSIQAKKKLEESVNSRAVGLDMRFEEDTVVDVIADNNLLTENVPVSTDSGIFSNSTTSQGNCPHLQDPNTDSELSLYGFGATETRSVNPDIVIKMKSLSLDKSRGPFSFLNQLSSLTVPSQKQVGKSKQNKKSKRQKYSRVKYSKAAKGKRKACNTKTKSLKPGTESVLETETVNRDSPLIRKNVPLGRPRGRPRKKPKVVNPEVERNKMDEMVARKLPSLRKNSKCTFARESIKESGPCGEVKSLISSTVKSRHRPHSMKARYSCTFPQVNNNCSELYTQRLLVRLEKLKSAPSRNVSSKCKENKNTQPRLDAKIDSVKPKQRQSRCSSSKCGGIAARTRSKGYEIPEKVILKNVQNSVDPVVKLVGIASSSENEKVSEFIDQGHSVKRLVNLLESDIKCSPSKRTRRAATCHHDPLVQSEQTSKDNTSPESSNDKFHLHFQPKTDSLPTPTSESLTRSIGGVMSYLFGDKLPSVCPSGFVINVRMDVEKKKSDNDSSTHSCQCAKNPLNSTASCHLIKGSDFNMCPCLDQMSDEQLSALLRKRIELKQDVNKRLKRRLLANIAQFMK